MKWLCLFLMTFTFSLSFASFDENQMIPGHSVYMTKNPDDTTEWKFRLLREANISIEMSTGYAGGQVFEELLQTLIFQLENNPKIQIHLIVFSVFDFVNDRHKALMQEYKERYPDRFEFCMTYETGLINQEGKAYISENHTKLIVVDEKYILLGGTNLLDPLSTADVTKSPPSSAPATKFLPKASNDMDVVASGPIAKKLRHDFFRMLALYQSGEPLEQYRGEFIPSKTAYFPVQDTDKCQIATFDESPETCHHAKMHGLIAGPRMDLHSIGAIYKYLIDKAEISISIGNMYFFPYEPIYQAMINAVNRHVSFSLVTNGSHDQMTINNSTRSLYSYINRLNYFPIMSGKTFKFYEMFLAKKAPQKNTSIHELDLVGVLYHKKVMAVDHRYSIVGSYNLGMKSEDAAHEVAVVIDSEEAACQLEAVLANDKLHSKSISYEQTMGWYFNPYYNLTEAVEKKFLDGIILKSPYKSMKDDFEEKGPTYPEDESFFPFDEKEL